MEASLEQKSANDVEFDAYDAEVNPEAAAWFKKYPKVQDALALDSEKKREFISKYYPKDDTFDQYLEKVTEESEKMVEQEIESGHNKMPFSENLVVGMVNIAKIKVVEDLVAEVDVLYKERRASVKGKDINDEAQVVSTQEYITKMGGLIEDKLVKQLEEEAKSRNLELNSFMGISVSYLMGDIAILVDIEKLYQLK
jgi:hypothetical protein